MDDRIPLLGGRKPFRNATPLGHPNHFSLSGKISFDDETIKFDARLSITARNRKGAAREVLDILNRIMDNETHAIYSSIRLDHPHLNDCERH